MDCRVKPGNDNLRYVRLSSPAKAGDPVFQRR
jgi:hypothetical protein